VFSIRNVNAMMTAGSYAPVEDQVDQYQPYRSMSKAAVVSLVLAILGFAGLLAPVMLVLPFVGIIWGLVAISSIRRYPLELVGRGIAISGVLLGASLVVGGSALHACIYLTEVPEGYKRISFADLQPDEEHPELPVPPNAVELNGKRVFVKGYLYPDGQRYNIKRFVLIPDMGTCCFGGQPALTDMIEVTLRDPLRTEFARRKRKLTGILTVDPRLKPVSGLTGVYYQLDADSVR
jgi:hypothetical protein